MRRAGAMAVFLAPMIGEAAIVGVVQFAPMALLTVGDYAKYSGVYLAYAALLALQLATLSDVWARAVRQDAVRLDDSRAYYAVLTSLATASVLITTPVAAVASQAVVPTVVAALAAAMALFRAGSRYYLIAAGLARKAGAADLLGAAAGLLTAVLLWSTGTFTLDTALALWALVNLVSLVASRATPSLGISATVAWFSAQRQSIGALLGEAGIMNLSSVGTPYAVGAIVGAPGLALHRGATSLAYPVRLVLGAIRSRILAGLVRRSVSTHVAMATLGLALGGGAIGCLLLARDHLLEMSALSLVAAHAAPVGVLIAGTTYSTFLQFEARGTMAPRTLLVRRSVHTALIVVVTVATAILHGVSGMIWGAAAATALSSVVWIQRPTVANSAQGALREDR